MRGIGHTDEMEACLETAVASLKSLGLISEEIFGEGYVHSNISPEQVEQVLIGLGKTLIQNTETQRPLEERVLQVV